MIFLFEATRPPLSMFHNQVVLKIYTWFFEVGIEMLLLLTNV